MLFPCLQGSPLSRSGLGAAEAGAGQDRGRHVGIRRRQGWKPWVQRRRGRDKAGRGRQSSDSDVRGDDGKALQLAFAGDGGVLEHRHGHLGSGAARVLERRLRLRVRGHGRRLPMRGGSWQQDRAPGVAGAGGVTDE